MKTLPHDVARCSGVIGYGDAQGDEWPIHEYCPERMACQRHLALIDWDHKAGIPNYQTISVHMAVEDCEHKIEAVPA